MDKFPLAKLVEWSGAKGVEGRKRLQKVVYFLQKAGCPFNAEYTLHHYGPYSRDVAEACDELVAGGVFVEQPVGNAVGVQYTYKLSCDTGVTAVRQTESRLGPKSTQVTKYSPLAMELLEKDTWELELGSTILYFFEKSNNNWEEAVRRACEFKKRDPGKEPKLAASRSLANMVCSWAAGEN